MDHQIRPMGTAPIAKQMNIADGVREFGLSTPGRVAVIDGDRSQTYAELDERSSRLGNALLSVGVTPGQTVGVVLGNRMEYCEIAAGLSKAGIIMVPVNPRLSTSEMQFILGHSGARVVITGPSEAVTVAPAVVDLGIPTFVEIQTATAGTAYEDFLATGRPVDPAVQTKEDDTFAVVYTSGTTGDPKGVMLSHRSRCLTILLSAIDYGLGPGRTTVAVAPMYHGAGFTFAYAAVHLGGTVVMLRKWDPEVALELISSHRANSVFMVPTHAQMLRSMGADTLRRYDVSALETIYFNAAALPFPLKQWVVDTFPGVGVHELYGSTECSVVTDLRPEYQLAKPGSVGPAWFMTDIQLLDRDGQQVPRGTVGELYARSPFLMNGYWNNREATDKCTNAEGYITAGDAARQDEDGFYYIVDRVKDLIISGGINIYPREIEDVLVRHEAVDQVAVIGMPDEKWGEQVTAVLVLRPGEQPREDELDFWCRESLAGFKVPGRYEFVQTLPSSAAGKILKRQLRADLKSSINK